VDRKGSRPAQPSTLVESFQSETITHARYILGRTSGSLLVSFPWGMLLSPSCERRVRSGACGKGESEAKVGKTSTIINLSVKNKHIYIYNNIYTYIFIYTLVSYTYLLFIFCRIIHIESYRYIYTYIYKDKYIQYTSTT
jgi:hypothetical protein